MNRLYWIGIIMFWIGYSLCSVGQMPARPPEPYPWYLPILFMLTIIPPSIFAYKAGREDERRIRENNE